VKEKRLPTAKRKRCGYRAPGVVEGSRRKKTEGKKRNPNNEYLFVVFFLWRKNEGTLRRNRALA